MREHDLLSVGLIVVPRGRGVGSGSEVALKRLLRQRQRLGRRGLGSAVAAVAGRPLDTVGALVGRSEVLGPAYTEFRGGWSVDERWLSRARSLEVIAVAEQAVHPDNRVQLSSSRDGLGSRLAAASWRLRDDDVDRISQDGSNRGSISPIPRAPPSARSTIRCRRPASTTTRPGGWSTPIRASTAWETSSSPAARSFRPVWATRTRHWRSWPWRSGSRITWPRIVGKDRRRSPREEERSRRGEGRRRRHRDAGLVGAATRDEDRGQDQRHDRAGERERCRLS